MVYTSKCYKTAGSDEEWRWSPYDQVKAGIEVGPYGPVCHTADTGMTCSQYRLQYIAQLSEKLCKGRQKFRHTGHH